MVRRLTLNQLIRGSTPLKVICLVGLMNMIKDYESLDIGLIPIRGKNGLVAPMVEQDIEDVCVEGSNPFQTIEKYIFSHMPF